MPDLDVAPKPVQATEVEASAPRHPLIRLTLEFAAVLAWILIVCQVFFYDLEGALIRHLLPGESWPFASKFFVSTFVISAILLGMRYPFFRRAFSFVLFF